MRDADVDGGVVQHPLGGQREGERRGERELMEHLYVNELRAIYGG